MTQRSAHDARIHVISEGVVASYIREISAGTPVATPARARGSARGAPARGAQLEAPPKWALRAAGGRA
jgi:hypothetical protein